MKKIFTLVFSYLLTSCFLLLAADASAQCANLTPYQPGGWDSKLVISTATGTSTSASSFNNQQTLYVDWAALNNGSCAINQTFYVRVYVDGSLYWTWTVTSLSSNTYTYGLDAAIGPLSAGSHTITVTADTDNNIYETSEGDNSFSRTITVGTCANLTLYQPGGWDNKMVLSTVSGTNNSASSFLDNQTIYIDWASLNSGSCALGQNFTTKLYVDGSLYTTWTTTGGLNSNTYTYLQDGIIGPLSAGTHTLQLTTDADNNVGETNESDNTYSRTITVASSICINLTPYIPNGYDDKLVLSTSAGAKTSSGTFFSNQTIYATWGLVNNGTCAISQTFKGKLYVDGSLLYTYTMNGIAANTYTYSVDNAIGPLSVGTHTIQFVGDAEGNVSESNESDNSYSKTITVISPPCVNLTPYQAPGYDDKIVVSTTTGTNTSASNIADNQTLYIDWAAINNGTCNISQTFYTKLYVDGVLKTSYSSTGLAANYFSYVNDISVGPLSAGTHTIQITTDGDANVAETDENDNSYVRTITVKSSSCVNLTPYKPDTWDDKIVVSTSSGTNTSATSFTTAQTIWVDVAVINNGTCNISQTFNNKIYLDGVLKYTFSTYGLASNYYSYLSDLSLGTLTAGTHTIQVTSDGDAGISESNEMDNSYSRVINVTSTSLSCPWTDFSTAFNGTRTLYTEYYGTGDYRLNDICQPAGIHIFDWNSTAATTTNPLEITAANNSWTTTNQRFGASVLWAAKQAYNYFLNNHSRKAYDDANGKVTGYVNVVFSAGTYTYTDNASMSSTGGQLSVGLGASGTLANSWCTVDLIGHEYTHAVTGASAGLEYQNESGALNESFSDVFGESIENATLGSNDWKIGADRTSGAIRSMADPKLNSNPDTYQGSYWVTGTSDYGGVHTNSGVQNKWFYLLAHGGSGANDKGYSYNITGIGIVKARAIAYRNLTVYLTSTSNYAAARSGSIQAAEDLYGVGSVEAETVKSAWCAVGVGTCAPVCTTPTAVTVTGGGLSCNSMTLTATGGSGGTIYWQGTSSNGQSTGSAETSHVVMSSGTYYFRAMNSCGIWGPEGSATVTINSGPNNWTGAVSSSWENPLNWSCGVLPDANTNVVINSGTVIVNSNTTCRSLTISPGATFKVNPGYRVTITH